MKSYRLDSSGAIKVGDFGLAEDVYESGYFRQRERANVKLPFKWMALESLEDAIFTEKTDVVCGVYVCVCVCVWCVYVGACDHVTPSVVIWCDSLGDFQWWADSLSCNEPYVSRPVAERWEQAGETQQCCL